MKIRLYLDEDTTSSALVSVLRARGIDLVTVEEAHMRGRSDEDQLRYATEQGRVLYTFNVGDFMALHTHFLQDGISHTGIILGQNTGWSVGNQLRAIAQLIKFKTAEDMENQAEFLRTWEKKA